MTAQLTASGLPSQKQPQIILDLGKLGRQRKEIVDRRGQVLAELAGNRARVAQLEQQRVDQFTEAARSGGDPALAPIDAQIATLKAKEADVVAMTTALKKAEETITAEIVQAHVAGRSELVELARTMSELEAEEAKRFLPRARDLLLARSVAIGAWRRAWTGRERDNGDGGLSPSLPIGVRVNALLPGASLVDRLELRTQPTEVNGRVLWDPIALLTELVSHFESYQPGPAGDVPSTALTGRKGVYRDNVTNHRRVFEQAEQRSAELVPDATGFCRWSRVGDAPAGPPTATPHEVRQATPDETRALHGFGPRTEPAETLAEHLTAKEA